MIEIEKGEVNILAFSIGGAIAWKFGIESANINSLVCVSSTRLRNETTKPKGDITLYYGSNDEFKPEIEWLDNMDLNYDILSDKGHHVYRENDLAEQQSKQIIENIKTTA